MELLTKTTAPAVDQDTKKIQEAVYWSQVVLHGLEDQGKLIERSKHLVDRMKPDEYVSHKDSAYEKVQRALSEGSVHPLRELKTVEKGVLVKDLKEKALQALIVLGYLP